MNPLVFINTLGPILASAIFLAGIYALVICKWADSPRWVRRALIFSCMPFAFSVIGALVGLVIVVRAEPDHIQWYNLGKTCLVGLVVTLPPLVWSLLRLRSRGRPDVAGSPT